MNVLLIGPYPPPHGGISVHLLEIHRRLTQLGVHCRVLNTNRQGPDHPACIRLGSWFQFAVSLWRHARQGWTLHCHTNGHNWKSWVIALGCGLTGRPGRSLLTLHSGFVPDYLRRPAGRLLASLACSRYARVLCVSYEIREAVLSLGVAPARTEVLPAYLQSSQARSSLDGRLLEWAARHRPLLSTALFFRPEYGFDLLLCALARLRQRHNSLGCLVIGSGEQRAQAEKRIREEGMEDHVLLAGDLDHDVCLALISASHVFVRPTLTDGDSISVREAIALGVPVVASNSCRRPSGVLVFEVGNVEDFTAKMELALVRPRREPQPVADGADRLTQIYRQVAASSDVCMAA